MVRPAVLIEKGPVMRQRVRFVVLGVLVALSMGASCRQETAQSVLSTLLSAIAETTGDAIGQSLTHGTGP